ncbi:mechanosensitive ion channel family protein [Sphingobacterium rhinopitheci]|uniref:mechanosensitive ion channel family protein n=1 Tax=Sphingobacterium rhinopitheci TaxID=2781960 RepID=UPI001F528AB0|nr:mechanosensitive ion channel domain-containing protein [Sphingobacterium rhinopitheci]MCI0922708.1 mechanosensitive ion channel [Sphingobacterium rhinopitheci]
MFESIIKIIDSWEIDIKILLAKLILGLTVLLIFYAIGKSTKSLAYKINSKLLVKYKDLQIILSKAIYFFFLFIGCYLFLQIIGLEQYFVKLLAGAGIVGIIAGFALKDIASNAFSGLLLFFEKPYKKGDWVQVDGHCGEVVNVGVLTTAVKNKTGQEIFVSNQLIYSGTFVNYSTYNNRAIRLQTDIEQFFDLDKVRTLLTNELKTISTFDPSKEIKYYVDSISIDGSFSLEIFFWVIFTNEEDFLKTISDTLIHIKKVSSENNINIINTKWISDEEDSTSAGNFGAND